MNELSFNIKNSFDFFNKLLEDHSDFLANNTSSRIAINCAMTSWHLTEWIFNEYNFIRTFNKLSDFQKHIKQECQSIQIMHDISNGSKHYLLTRHKSKIEETKLHQGSFSNDFSRGFDISTLDVKLKSGEKIYFEDEIQKTISFWKKYLRELTNTSNN